MALCLEIEPPEKRVLAWLAHLNTTQKEESEYGSLETSSGTHWENCSTVQRQEKNAPEHIKQRTNVFVSPSGSQSSVIGRRTYSYEESSAIIRYITENDVFPFIKGNLLWKKMEVDKVCTRSWQSMKTQFLKKIYPNLGIYSVKKNDKEKFIQYMERSTPKKAVTLEPGQRGWRRNGNYYRLSEDKVIINYILQRHRYLHVLGNTLWKTMEEEKVLPDRTWQSMRSRYLNFIFRDLEQYKLKESVVRKLRRIKRADSNYKKEDENLRKRVPLSLHTDDVNRNKKKKEQDLRRHAINTGINLATKLGITKTENVLKNEIPSKNSSQSKESPVSISQPVVENNAAKKKIYHDSDISSENFLKSVLPDSVSDPVSGFSTCGLGSIDSITNFYKNTTTNADNPENDICTQEEGKRETIKKECEHVFHMLEQNNSTNPMFDTAVEVNVEVLQKENNNVDQTKTDINSYSHPQEIINVNLEENCSETVEKTVLEYAEISPPDINDPMSHEHSFHSEDTVIYRGNIGNVQAVNKGSVSQTNLCFEEEEGEKKEDTFVYSEFSSSRIEKSNCEKCFAHLNLSPSSN